MKSLLIFIAITAASISNLTIANAAQSESEREPAMRLVPQFSNSAISDLIETADGSRLISHDSYYAPKVWDAKTLKLLGSLGRSNYSVHRVIVSKDGKHVLTRSSGQIRLWDTHRLKLIWSIETAEDDPIYNAIFSPSGTKVAYVTQSLKLTIVDINNPNKKKEYSGIKDYTLALKFLSDSRIAGGGDGSDILIWDTGKSQPIFSINIGNVAVYRMDSSSDGSVLIATTSNKEVVGIDSNQGKVLYRKKHLIADDDTFIGHDTSARFVGKSGLEFFCAQENGNIEIYSGKSGTLVRELKGHTSPIYEVRLSADRTKLYSLSIDQKAFVWDITSGAGTPFVSELKDRTTASFSSDGSELLVGFLSGDIRRYNWRTGEMRQEQLGSITGAHKVRFLGRDRLQYFGSETYSEPSIQSLQESNFRRIFKRGQIDMDFNLDQASYCETGRYAFSIQSPGFSSKNTLVILDLDTGQKIFTTEDSTMDRVEWIPNTQSVLISWRDGNFRVFNCGTKKTEMSWKHESKGAMCTPSPNGDLISIYGGTQRGYIFDTKQGVIHSVLEQVTQFPSFNFKFSPSQKLLAGASQSGVAVWDVKSGKLLSHYSFQMGGANVYAMRFSSDERQLFLGGEKFRTYDIYEKKLVAEFPVYYMVWESMSQVMSPDQSRILLPESNFVRVVGTRTGLEEFRIELNSPASTAVFSPDGRRIVTSDGVDHLTIWDSQPVQKELNEKPVKSALKLGNIAQTNDGSLLVMDMQGRFDAKDPSDVRAAIYVKEWTGGLESLEVSQFKSIYWDPGLLQKLLGVIPSKPRDVPSLANLRLFPEVSFKPSGKSRMDVAIKPRDNGGIGRVQVFINGKIVEEKQGTGYFSLDLEKLQQFMLPENLLPKGQGNLLGVKVTNEDGTLASEIKVFDVGIPAGLKVPEVKLYALFCGVSDYVGESDDLGAPASDAQKLEEAIKKTAGKLLDSRIETTLLTTKNNSPDQRPTRANIMKWLADTQQKATSSDIVLIFFAGHGIDKLGSKSGYFFLTSESQPSEITEASLASMSISGEDLKSMLGKISASKQVVVLDTCHSGAAGTDLVGESRSVSGDYARAFEAIKDATGTWMLAGSAADQRSYESVNVDHGMLTYALLEAIDRGNAAGLRQAPSGELFVDVERWLQYAAARVESLKNEVGLSGLQRPEFKRSKAATTFDLGVMDESNRGFLGLKAPKPVVLLGSFQMEEEDPAGLEEVVKSAFKDATKVKAWFDASKHPNVYRVAGSYTTSGENIEMKIFLQKFDALGQRKTLETFTVKGTSKTLAALGANVLSEVEKRIVALEEAKIATP